MKTLEDFKDYVAKLAGAQRTRAETFAQQVCIFCNARCLPEDFCDEESRQEYRISRMCQKCQGAVFGDEDEL